MGQREAIYLRARELILGEGYYTCRNMQVRQNKAWSIRGCVYVSGVGTYSREGSYSCFIKLQMLRKMV